MGNAVKFPLIMAESYRVQIKFNWICQKEHSVSKEFPDMVFGEWWDEPYFLDLKSMVRIVDKFYQPFWKVVSLRPRNVARAIENGSAPIEQGK